MAALLDVQDLAVEYAASRALDAITLEVREGEVVAVLGESGSGKTTLGLAILGLLPSGGRIVQGSIRFRGRDLLSMSEKALEALRGAELSMIFQEADLALNPFLRAIDQVAEVLAVHRGSSRRACREEAEKMLREVRLDQDTRLFSAYPHQLSGGERQRLVIAQALACRPSLLIADEPTSSLDLILQREWLALIQELRRRLKLSLLLITHDPAILVGVADRVLVMQAGRIVEETTVPGMFELPRHPYTQMLLRSMAPAPGTGGVKKRLPVPVQS